MQFSTLLLALGLPLFAMLSPTTGQADQVFLSLHQIPDGEVINIDSSWFSNDDDIESTDILIEGTLSITVPVPIDTDPPPDYESYSSDVIQQSLPYLLREFGVDESEIQELVDEGIPLIRQGVIDAVNGVDDNASARAQEVVIQGILSWIAKVISKATNIITTGAAGIACGVWSSAATPFFTGGAYLFEAINTNHPGVPTSDDQDFWIHPIDGTLSHDDNVNIHFNAAFPWPIPSNRLAITWGRDVYVNGYTAEAAGRTSSNFVYITRNMLHELTHVKQFKNLGYITPAFGAKYLWQNCMVGFSYAAIPMELEAVKGEKSMDPVITSPIGREFQRLYNDNSLQSLGLPTATTFSGPDASSNYQFTFDSGVMTIQCPGSSPPCS